jgi:3-methyladenine DNA glycosylase AlkD
MAISHISIVTHLRSLGKGVDKSAIARFFKTGEGEYAEKDQFLGLTVPAVRLVAKQNVTITHRELVRLLRRKEHEARQCALEILKLQFGRADDEKRFALLSLYLDNTEYINNWDLVDLSAKDILGEYLSTYQVTTTKSGRKVLSSDGGKLLRSLAHSTSIWERRIAIVATQGLLKIGLLEPTIDIATLLLQDKHDLIQKAVGWTLREMGKVGEAGDKALHLFIIKHGTTMPRTTLRYAIERMTEGQREMYMAKE